MAVTNGTRALVMLGRLHGILETPEDLNNPNWHSQVLNVCALEEIAFFESLLDQHLGNNPDELPISEISERFFKLFEAYAVRRSEFVLKPIS